MHDGHYEFYIIQTKQEELSQCLRIPDGNKSPPKYEEQDTDDEDTMSAFLRDVYSVDTYFVFGPTRKAQENCLWAHRTVLAKYPVFDVLLKQASFSNSKAGLEPLKVTVTNVSFAVFAALLKFIYLGDIQRLNYPASFAISMSGVWSPTNLGGAKDAHRWHSMDLGTPLSKEPVTWQELHDAATIYKLEALRARCESALKTVSKVDITRSLDAE